MWYLCVHIINSKLVYYYVIQESGGSHRYVL